MHIESMHNILVKCEHVENKTKIYKEKMTYNNLMGKFVHPPKNYYKTILSLTR